jgi:signal transduction histidine kinase
LSTSPDTPSSRASSAEPVTPSLRAARSLARTALDRMLAKAIRIRLVIAPALGSLALTFAFFEPTPWRRQLLATCVAVLTALSFVEWLRYRKLGLSAVQVPLNVLLTVLAQLGLLTASGGLFSPVFPAVVIMVMLTALLAELSTLIVLLALVIPYLWLLAFVHVYGAPLHTLIPRVFGGAQSIEHGPAPFMAVTLYTIVLSAAARVGRALQQLFGELFGEAVQERDRSLALHAEQSRTLTMLTSEIAHELKNPLASIKGLGALVAKDVQGRTAERTAVLRGEVDRMQIILEEFLNFSRPVVPLCLAPTDLAALARDVARLHEGSASERGVLLSVSSSGPSELACDPRKVRQVLINLVQNALEASPRGGQVQLRVEGSARELHVAVIDQGPGLPPELHEGIFEAGVTSKEHGSGIGLVVARGLARQHGGDVALAPGPHGGVVASLRLPRTPEPAQAARAADAAPQSQAGAAHQADLPGTQNKPQGAGA